MSFETSPTATSIFAALPASRCFRSIILGSSVQSQVQRLYYVSQWYIATRTTTCIFFLQRWAYRLGFLITFLFLAAQILVQICCENGTWRVTFFADVLLVSGTKNRSVPQQDLLSTFHRPEKYCLAPWPLTGRMVLLGDYFKVLLTWGPMLTPQAGSPTRRRPWRVYGSCKETFCALHLSLHQLLGRWKAPSVIVDRIKIILLMMSLANNLRRNS